MPLSTSSLPASDAVSKLPIDVAAPRGRNTPSGAAKDSPGDFGDLLNNQSSTDNPALADGRARPGSPATSAKSTSLAENADDTDTAETGELAGEPVESTDETTASSIAWLMANGFIVPPSVTPTTPPTAAPTDLSLLSVAGEGSAASGSTELGGSEEAADATGSSEESAGTPQSAFPQGTVSRAPTGTDPAFGFTERLDRSSGAASVETGSSVLSATQSLQRAAAQVGPEISSQTTDADLSAAGGPDLAGAEAAALPVAQSPTATERAWRTARSEAFASSSESEQAQADQLTAVAATTDLAESPIADATSKKVGSGPAPKSETFSLIDVTADAMAPAEKFAAVSDRSAEVANVLDKLGIKKTVEVDGDDVAEHAESIGTNAAKSHSAMPTLAAHADQPSTHDATSAFAVTSTDVVASASAVTHPEATSETASAARRSVESVLAVVDHFRTTGGQHGVNLKFNVGGVDLAVRVEIRGDQVQTTFRTDSPELRSALANEWRVVATESADRTQRVAEPVFTSSGGNSTSGGSAGQEQRGTFTRQDGTAFDEFVAARGALRRATAFASSSVAEVSTVTTASAPTARPGRLHVLA